MYNVHWMGENMKVILKLDIKGIGKAGNIVNVSDGHARNYLFPKNLAIEASAHNLAELKAKNESTERERQRNLEEAKKLSEKLKNIVVEIQVKAGENGKIFGGVTAKDISDRLKTEHKIDVDKKKIQLKDTIKNTGTYETEIKLDEGVMGSVKVNVVQE